MTNRRRPQETGTGLIGSLAGLLVISSLLALVTQVSIDLAVTSSVSAVGHDAVRRVAAAGVAHEDPVALREAQRRAEVAIVAHLLGGDPPEVRWWVRDGWVHLTIVLDRPRLAPAVVRSMLGARSIERSFRARVERP